MLNLCVQTLILLEGLSLSMFFLKFSDLTLRCLLENYSMLEDACTDHVDKKPKVEDTLSKPDRLVQD